MHLRVKICKIWQRWPVLAAAILLRRSHEYARLGGGQVGRPREDERMRIRSGSDADAAAAAAVVQRVLREHGLRLAPGRDRVPSRPAGGRRRLVLVPSFA
jgi:hypothetical protein